MQVFHPSTNVIAKASIFGGVLFLGVLGWIWTVMVRSSYATQEGLVREQPVPFSHKHHVEGLGIDCRYCHTSVEDSGFAGIPPTKTCMTCHSQIWTNAAMLEPVRESWRENKPLAWTRVHDLPDFVYFDHSIHVAKGIGCASCHGQVDQMPLTWQGAPLTMEWCLNCHRNPEKFIRPKDQVFSMDYKPENQLELGRELVKKHQVGDVNDITDCWVCHR